MTDNVNVALNKAECIKAQSNIGGTVYHNICDGTQSFVPWGSASWFEAVAVMGLAVIIFALLVFLVVTFLRW